MEAKVFKNNTKLLVCWQPKLQSGEPMDSWMDGSLDWWMDQSMHWSIDQSIEWSMDRLVNE